MDKYSIEDYVSEMDWATLVPEAPGKSFKAKFSKTNTGAIVAFTPGGTLLPLFSPESGRPITSISNGNTILIGEAIPQEQ